MHVERLATTIASAFAPDVRIDLFNVDTEGMDEAVLRSNDWVRIRPRFVVAEILNSADLTSLGASGTDALLRGQGYELVAKTLNSVVYMIREEASSP